MPNPIIQMMRKNNPMQMISNIRKMMSGQSPEMFAEILGKNNPQFAQFINENKDKTPEQICKDYGLDWNDIKSLL